MGPTYSLQPISDLCPKYGLEQSRCRRTRLAVHVTNLLLQSTRVPFYSANILGNAADMSDLPILGDPNDLAARNAQFNNSVGRNPCSPDRLTRHFCFRIRFVLLLCHISRKLGARGLRQLHVDDVRQGRDSVK